MEKINNREHTGVSLEDQKAFKEIGEKLIFTSPQNLELSQDNIAAISKEIQNEFIDVFDIKYKEHFSLSKILGNLEDRPDEPKFSEMRNNNGQKEYLESILRYLYISNASSTGTSPGSTYDNLGFTPKLALESKNNLSGMNCFGTNIFVGAFCKRADITVSMGITADHPVLFTEIEGQTFLVDGIGSKFNKAFGKTEDHGTYKIYYPTKEDGLLHQMVMVHDFNNAVVYETLENLQAYKESLTLPSTLLPHKRTEALKLAEKHASLFEKGDWRKMQRVLFPEIYKSFTDNKEEWLKEVLRMRNEREENNIYEIFTPIAGDAVKYAGWHNLTQEEIGKSEMNNIKKYGLEIYNYFYNDTPLSTEIPEDIRKFYNKLFEGIAKQDKNTQILLKDIVAGGLLDKNENIDNNSKNSKSINDGKESSEI